MTPYGKSAQTAIAAVSRLAEVYDGHKLVKLNSAEIAEKRQLPQPVVAKVLTLLSQVGLVNGSPGPGGGYWLARPPEAIALYDVVSLFERLDENISCPFGPNYCGLGPHCPMHFDLMRIREQLIAFLKETTFARFTAWQPEAAGPPNGETTTGRSLDLIPTPK